MKVGRGGSDGDEGILDCRSFDVQDDRGITDFSILSCPFAIKDENVFSFPSFRVTNISKFFNANCLLFDIQKFILPCVSRMGQNFFLSIYIRFEGIVFTLAFLIP